MKPLSLELMATEYPGTGGGGGGGGGRPSPTQRGEDKQLPADMLDSFLPFMALETSIMNRHWNRLSQSRSPNKSESSATGQRRSKCSLSQPSLVLFW